MAEVARKVDRVSDRQSWLSQSLIGGSCALVVMLAGAWAHNQNGRIEELQAGQAKIRAEMVTRQELSKFRDFVEQVTASFVRKDDLALLLDARNRRIEERLDAILKALREK